MVDDLDQVLELAWRLLVSGVHRLAESHPRPAAALHGQRVNGLEPGFAAHGVHGVFGQPARGGCSRTAGQRQRRHSGQPVVSHVTSPSRVRENGAHFTGAADRSFLAE